MMAPSFFKKAADKLGVAKKKNPTDSSQAAKTTDTGNLVVKPSLPSKTTQIPSDEPFSLPTSTATLSQISSALDSDTLILQASTTKEDLWDLAYKVLKDDKKKSRLIGKYEGILLEDSTGGSASPSTVHDVSSIEGREQQLSRVVQDKFQAVQDARWKFAIFSKEIEVREQFDRAVGAVTWAKDFITQAVSPDPHAALAWAGVSVLLPLLLNPSLQRNAAIEGLDTVSNLIRQSKVIDEIYFERKGEVKTQALWALTGEFRDKRIRLYSQILEFEAQLVCYFSTSKVEQTVRDMIKYDSWAGMVENIQKMGELSSSDRQIIDAERMKAGFEKFDRISKSIEDGLSGLRRRWEDQDRQDILGWLSRIDFRTRQIDTFSRRQEGTGQWLFEDPAFERWLCGTERTLWCRGIPGAGKTILASTVIDYFERRFYEDNVGIAFLYCNYKEQETQTLQDLIGSLVQQLVQRNADVPDDLRAIYDVHAKYQPPTPPTVTECVRLLRSQLAGCPSVFLVIDALDECKALTRQELCAHLQDLPNNIHFLMTSRDIPEIKDDIMPSTELKVRANDRDIQIYLEDQIKRKTRLKRHIKNDPELGALITNTIRDKAAGMFLLAQLHLESLVGNHTPNDVRESLEKLPTSLDAIYDDVMERISKDKNDALLGKKVLTWISYARRPLTVAELQHAVKVETNSHGLGKGDMIPADLLISVCAGIVTVDKESNIIRLVHYSAQEYFQDHRSTLFQNAEREVATACLTYLSFDNFRNGYCETDEALEYLLRKNALLDYAACHWADHAREDIESIMAMTLNFLEDTSRVSLSFQVMTIGSYRYSGYSQVPPRRVSGLHLCAGFGMHLIPMIIRMLETQSNIDVKDSSGQTPLSWAAKYGHEAVVKLLLEKGADVDSKDGHGDTPLSVAITNNTKAVINLLLEKGANVESKNDDGNTPLLFAVYDGDEAMVKLLLEKGADVNSRNNYSRTPLWQAAYHGDEALVKLLLEKGADVNSKDYDGYTPLLGAVKNMHGSVVDKYEAVVKILLKKGADIESKGGGRTPLFWATSSRHEAIMKLLLEKGGAYVDSKDNDGRTLLWQAVYEEDEDMVKMLLEKGANIDSKDNDRWTPLWQAAYHGDEAMAKLLLEKGADIDCKGDNGMTPLWQAAYDGDEAMVKLLLEKGAVVDSKNDDGYTPLLGAIWNGHEVIVKLLLEKGASVDSKDGYGDTPLSEAVFYGHEAIVKLLLENGARFRTKGKVIIRGLLEDRADRSK